jgi:putative sigma-54 modulation protein
MAIQIRAKQITVTEKLRDYIEKKLDKLDRYLPTINDLQLELAQEHHRQGGDRVAVQLTLRDKSGMILRVEDKSQGDVYAAVDIITDKMYRQIGRFKGKRRRHAGERFAQLEPEFAAAEDVPVEIEQDEEPVIIRRKQLAINTMNEQEAIDQLELLGHDFFMFNNGETGRINVLYRRKSGGYGVLDPAVS